MIFFPSERWQSTLFQIFPRKTFHAFYAFFLLQRSKLFFFNDFNCLKTLCVCGASGISLAVMRFVVLIVVQQVSPAPSWHSCVWCFSVYLSKATASPRSGELRTQKLMSHLVRTQSLNVLPFEPGVGQSMAVHAMLTAREFFLAYFYPSSPFTCIFFPKPLPIFSCWPAE